MQEERKSRRKSNGGESKAFVKTIEEFKMLEREISEQIDQLDKIDVDYLSSAYEEHKGEIRDLFHSDSITDTLGPVAAGNPRMEEEGSKPNTKTTLMHANKSYFDRVNEHLSSHIHEQENICRICVI